MKRMKIRAFGTFERADMGFKPLRANLLDC